MSERKPKVSDEEFKDLLTKGKNLEAGLREDVQKLQNPPTAIEAAFANAQKAKQQTEEAAETALGETLGNDILSVLDDPEAVKRISGEKKSARQKPPKGLGIPEQQQEASVTPAENKASDIESSPASSQPAVSSVSDPRLSREEREMRKKREEEIMVRDIASNARVLLERRAMKKDDSEFVQELQDLGWSKASIRRIIGMANSQSAKKQSATKTGPEQIASAVPEAPEVLVPAESPVQVKTKSPEVAPVAETKVPDVITSTTQSVEAATTRLSPHILAAKRERRFVEKNKGEDEEAKRFNALRLAQQQRKGWGEGKLIRDLLDAGWTNEEVEEMKKIAAKEPEVLTAVESPVAETKSPEATPADEYMELIQNMYKGQPIPPKVQAVYEDIQKSVASKDDVARDAALEKLRGFVAERQTEIEAETKVTQHKPEIPVLTDVVDIETEPVLAANPEDALDQEHLENVFSTEGTPLEWRNKLRGLINGAKEKLGMGERAEKLKGYFSGRSEELNKESVGYGTRIENFIRAKGEEYNKLSFTKKLLIGGILGVGAAAFSTVSTPLATAFAINLGIQRAAGMASMFMKIESHLKRFDAPILDSDSESLKQKIQKRNELSNKALAAVLATGYTVFVGAAVGGAVHYASESSAGQAVHEWLRNVLELHVPVAAAHIEAPQAPASVPEVAALKAPMLPDADIKLNQAAIEKGWQDFNPGKPFPGNEIASADINRHMLETPMQPAAAASAPEGPRPVEAVAAPASVASQPASSGDVHSGMNKIPTPSAMPEGVQPAAAAVAGEVAATADTPEISGIKVTATPGHGYEYMMKRLWEQLQEKHIGLPENANPNSDLAQLLAADEKTIDGVVHKLAQDNEFFKGDGSSARINLDSKLTIDTNGQILLGHDNMLAPEESTVPAPNAEVPLAPVPQVEVGPSTIPTGVDVTSPEVAPPEKVVPPVFEQNYSGEETPASAEPSQSIQVDHIIDADNHKIEGPITLGPVDPNFPVNVHGLVVPKLEPHIYANETKSLFVYGGTPEQKMKMITEYLTSNPDKVLYAEDANGHRVPWLRELGGKGKIMQGPLMRTNGLAGLFSSLMKAPSPDDLKTLVK